MFCAIALQAATFQVSSLGEQIVCVPPCGRDSFMFPCFSDGVPMFVVVVLCIPFLPFVISYV